MLFVPATSLLSAILVIWAADSTNGRPLALSRLSVLYLPPSSTQKQGKIHLDKGRLPTKPILQSCLGINKSCRELLSQHPSYPQTNTSHRNALDSSNRRPNSCHHVHPTNGDAGSRLVLGEKGYQIYLETYRLDYEDGGQIGMVWSQVGLFGNQVCWYVVYWADLSFER